MAATKSCENCGKLYVPKRVSHRFCSRDCRWKAFDTRRREQIVRDALQRSDSRSFEAARAAKDMISSLPQVAGVEAKRIVVVKVETLIRGGLDSRTAVYEVERKLLAAYPDVYFDFRVGRV